MLSRRRLLVLGASGGALLALGGVGLSWQPGVSHPPRRALTAFGPREFSTLWAVAERVCPGRDGWPPASRLDVAEKVDALVGGLHPGDRSDLNRLLQLLENGAAGLLLDGQPAPFTARSPEAQDATLDGWRHSALTLRRTGYKALTGLIAATYYAQPEVWPLVGYPGPPVHLLRRP